MKDWQKDEITPGAIEKFLQVHGKRGVKTLSLLGRNHNIYEFATSDIGQSLLKDIMAQMERLLTKIIDGTAKQEETIEYRVLSKFFNDLTGKLDIFLKAREKIQG